MTLAHVQKTIDGAWADYLIDIVRYGKLIKIA
jgi:hypothetical protein